MKVLIVGAGGLLGRALLRAPRPPGVSLVGLDRAACDVTDPAARGRALAAHQPDAVLFCAASTDVDAAARDPASERVNAVAPGEWAAEVATWFVSSNFVFDGPGPHAPDAPPRPGSVYARQKVAAERAVRAAGGHVVRVGWMYGPGGRTFASTLAERLARGEAVRAIDDVLVQPTHVDDVARALLELPRGVTHLAGGADTTWYGFASAVRARVGAGHVVPVPLRAFGLGPRPRDARLAPATLPPWWDRLP